jgi:hypothetical protein
MSSTGPKGPSDIPAMARVLQFRRAESTTVQAPAQTKDVAATPPEAPPSPSPAPAAVFDHAPGVGGTVSAPVEGAALSQLIARLKARGGSEQVAALHGPTVVQTSEGPVLSGSLQIEGRGQLQKLDGVVRVGGDLAVSGIVKNADLLALREVKTIEGRLTFEGLRSKPPIDG